MTEPNTKCPQCGTPGYSTGAECAVCGCTGDEADAVPIPRSSMREPTRDIMNGIGVGCSTMTFVWLFAYSVVFAIAAHIHEFTKYGPALANLVPVLIVAGLYMILRRKPTNFSKGVGYSLLISLVFALIFAWVGTHFHDTKPPPNGAGNGFE